MPESRSPDYVRFHARARPGHTAFVDLATGRRWSYSELDVAVDRYVTALRERWGAVGGERVAVLARNGAEQFLTLLACTRIGAVFVPLNWRLAEAELRQLLADCEPRVLLHDASHASLATAIAGDVAVATLASLHGAAEGAVRASVVPVDPDAPTTILYTSGTSGRPKGVLITEANAWATGLNFIAVAEVVPTSVILTDSPMFHTIGLVASIRTFLMQGATILMSAGFDPEVTLARIADPALGVTHYFCVPQMADRLRATPGFTPAKLARLTAFFTGGAPNPAANVRRWLADGIRMCDGYGMTEAGTVLGMPLDRAQLERKAGAAGIAAPNVEVRIVDADGRDLPDGCVGELWLRGANVMPGYWRRPVESAEAFAAGRWYRSGDLACRDAEGFISIVGRRKEMYISGGENVYPVEVESCLIEHPAIAEVAVVGVPDPQWGEVGQAFVVLKAGVGADEAELRTFAERRIAKYKIPRRWSFVGSLPRTSTGKLQKHLLKQGG